MHFTVGEDSKYKYTEKWKTCMSAGMEIKEWGLRCNGGGVDWGHQWGEW